MHGIRAPRRVARCLALTVLGSLFILPGGPARANHIPGATYNGTVDGGGTVSFTISSDGNTVTTFQIQNVPGDSCTFIQATATNIPITNHTFTRTASPGLSASGSFPTIGNAQGTVRAVSFGFPSCDTGTKNWTATAPVPPTSPKNVKLKATPKTVDQGERTRLTATVSPCPGHEGHMIDFYRGRKKIASKASNASCQAKLKVRMQKTATFQAVSPQQDVDHSEGRSNKVRVRVI